MRYSYWLMLVDEYAKAYYCFEDALDDTNVAFEYYAQGDSPKDYVDGLALKYGLDSYPDLHWGRLPPAFDLARYTIKPSHFEE